MSQTKCFTTAAGVPVADNTNIMTAGRRGPALLQGVWLIEKLAHFDREVIPSAACMRRAGAPTAPSP
jgi:catalase